MKLISAEYVELNKKMHEDSDFGNSECSLYMVDVIKRYYLHENCKSLLDYGCGKGVLKKKYFHDAIEYDPCVTGKESDPKPCDLVACLDVLEHIEPEYLDNVLEHISEKMLITGILQIATRPAVRVMDDGRNAHLIVKNAQWWLNKLENHFDVVGFNGTKNFINVFIKPKKEEYQ